MAERRWHLEHADGRRWTDVEIWERGLVCDGLARCDDYDVLISRDGLTYLLDWDGGAKMVRDDDMKVVWDG